MCTFGHFLEPISSNSIILPGAAGGGEREVSDAVRVLVIEDDQLIQLIVEEALSDGGFQSDVTGSGEEAMTLLQGNKTPYRAIITDINLAGKRNGWEVAQRSREIDPSMPVIYMTGTHAEDWASRGVPNSVMLTKPFAPAQLVTALSNLLNAVVPPSAPTE
jgi:DNA-binding response OmpR family regulator